MAEAFTCPVCYGECVVPCDCYRCREPEAQAMGLMGREHRDRSCGYCRGTGEVDAEALEDFIGRGRLPVGCSITGDAA